MYLGLVLVGATPQVVGQDVPSDKTVINSRPTRDFVADIREQVRNGSLDLNSPFTLELTASLTKDGKLDPKSAKFTQIDGDPKMVGVSKSAIEALNDGGYFQYLNSLGQTELVIRLHQDDKTFSGSVTVDAVTERRAQTLRSGFDLVLKMEVSDLQQRKDRPVPANDILMFKHITASSAGKSVSLSIVMPKAEFWQIVVANPDAVKSAEK